MLRLAFVLVALPLFFVPTAQAVVDPEAISDICYRTIKLADGQLGMGNATLAELNRTNVPTDEGQDLLWAATQGGRAGIEIARGYLAAAREACHL